ncbi:hypothetical protein [Mycobacterium sp. NAZ190054]|uniref:hypothetical protein n=1 Tax=Mycobacterium sp. NAZ190054 TaxID=1747766 RepID=UPI000793BFCE|nr:hypothetical protein [Mycobacterium sp. NAZ190054]KWX66846.1 hypothetical protein ASJ79_05630 [Mycobacterium sp. NAZ190054]
MQERGVSTHYAIAIDRYDGPQWETVAAVTPSGSEWLTSVWPPINADIEHGGTYAVSYSREKAVELAELHATLCAKAFGSAHRPIWTPADADALRALAEEFPREVGQSFALAELMETEGLSL